VLTPGLPQASLTCLKAPVGEVKTEYNPNIVGFTEAEGPIVISLKEARTRYGKLPSEYRLVSPKNGRRPKKALNLSVGRQVRKKLEDEAGNLKGFVSAFFRRWHRDYAAEFGVNMEPFLHFNDPAVVKRILTAVRDPVARLRALDLRAHMAQTGLIRKDILNSIRQDVLMDKCEQLIRRKVGNEEREGKKLLLQEALSIIDAKRIISRINFYNALEVKSIDDETLEIYVDEISQELYNLSRCISVHGIEKIKCISAKGIEFEYATKDVGYLMLGKQTGDCTADKAAFQADNDVENIYWTVFPWILDRNYQILKVFYDGVFVMKVHLLPLYIAQGNRQEMVLGMDAVETVRSFRDDRKDEASARLLDHRESIFAHVIDRIREIGRGMGLAHIYAERFSNTGWVRDCLSRFPEIYLPIGSIIKIDELEDLFYLSRELCEDAQEPPPGEIFMEIQMKNTHLLPEITGRTKGIKSFAVIEGSPGDGIPMKSVIGV